MRSKVKKKEEGGVDVHPSTSTLPCFLPQSYRTKAVLAFLEV